MEVSSTRMKNKKYSQKEIINVAAIHLLNLATLSLMKSAFQLASKTEPWALKGLNAPDYVFEADEFGVSIIDLELELLGLVEDENVVLLIEYVNKIIACKNSFININGINFLDYIADEEIFNIAENIYVWTDPCIKSYEEIVSDDCDLKYFLYLNLWRCAEILSTEIALIQNEQEEIFNDLFCSYLQGIIESENSNAQLVLDLIADIGNHLSFD
jgi:hypothetical protein